LLSHGVGGAGLLAEIQGVGGAGLLAETETTAFRSAMALTNTSITTATTIIQRLLIVISQWYGYHLGIIMNAIRMTSQADALII